jgi:hypothetical protein
MPTQLLRKSWLVPLDILNFHKAQRNYAGLV